MDHRATATSTEARSSGTRATKLLLRAWVVADTHRPVSTPMICSCWACRGPRRGPRLGAPDKPPLDLVIAGFRAPTGSEAQDHRLALVFGQISSFLMRAKLAKPLVERGVAPVKSTVGMLGGFML
jgi:hypothetical protein